MKETKMGRPPRTIPRRQRHCYMTEDTIQRIKRYQNDEATRGEEYSFSDAVERMINIAASVESKAKLVPAREVFDDLPGALAPDWVLVDANNGRQVRCRTCGETYNVPADRFAGCVKGIGKFIEAHRDCGDSQAEE